VGGPEDAVPPVSRQSGRKEVGVRHELVRRLRRARSRLLCRLGRHMWATRRNPEVGGPQAQYETCRRCGRERQTYDVPKATGSAWGWTDGSP
jgi:hypothetical protein